MVSSIFKKVSRKSKKVINKISGNGDNAVYKLFPEVLYPIEYPDGETEHSLLNYLKDFRLDGHIGNELENYLSQDFKRFVYTLNLVSTEDSYGKSLLEIGANPYFTSILLEKFTAYNLFYTNYFGSENTVLRQIHRNKNKGEKFEFNFANFNVDADEVPFSEKFDVVLLCEVIEHLVIDPVLAILNIKKALKKNGVLILTTPNVNRLENVAKMIAGANIYDPYSGYGAYGRHNREYNKHELFMLLSHLGFEIELMFSSDVHPNLSNNFCSLQKLAEIIQTFKNRELDLGQYIFIKAKNTREAKSCKPQWLFRSYPSSDLCDDC
ncbi:MAG: methyltransferase domain-containing protein [Cyanobacteria bacterium P01_B01_bin.77]